jgi:hypothetical protein
MYGDDLSSAYLACHESLLGLLIVTSSLKEISKGVSILTDRILTYSVLRLLVFVALLVGGCLLVVWLTVLLGECLPAVT